MITKTCAVSLDALVDYLLGLELSDEEAVRRHLAEFCPSCMTHLRVLRLVLDEGPWILNIGLN